MRNLDEQMDLFSPLEPVPINPITGDPELTAPYDAELLAKSKRGGQNSFPRDVAVGALTSIPVGAACHGRFRRCHTLYLRIKMLLKVKHKG